MRPLRSAHAAVNAETGERETTMSAAVAQSEIESTECREQVPVGTGCAKDGGHPKRSQGKQPRVVQGTKRAQARDTTGEDAPDSGREHGQSPQDACPVEDIDAVSRYWQAHKALLLEPANEVFLDFVRPALLYGEEPFLDNQTLALLFTDWVLFDFAFFAGRTPLEQFVAHPVDVDGAQLARLRRIADSQFFSRFEILYKDRETGICALTDVRDGHRYDVLDPVLCRKEQWRDGTIGMRIARAAGPWTPVGSCHLYDRAPAHETAVDGPGFVHPEDAQLRPDAAQASFFLRMLRDLIGIDGRYRHTTTIPVEL